MALVRLSIPDPLAEKFRAATQLSPAEVVREAMTFYNWCIEESARDRLILSATPDGEDFTHMPVRQVPAKLGQVLGRIVHDIQGCPQGAGQARSLQEETA